MTIVVAGSIATDHLMRFPGRFSEQLIRGSLHAVSLSFLVDDLVVRPGGVAANVAHGLAWLGLRPVLVGAAGVDFADHRLRLERRGVDCSWIRTSDSRYTARFVCTTDDDMCQIASFYAGAMVEAADIDLAAVLTSDSPPGMVIVGADAPAAMLRHADTCRRLGVPFAADPSQQLAVMPGEDVRRFIEGCRYLLVNEYEYALLRSKTGLSPAGLHGLVDTVVTTLGGSGVRITGRDRPDVRVPAAHVATTVDPTGVGDGFRAGFFAALHWGLPMPDAARVGCQLAALVLQTPGPQEYVVEPERFCADLARSYGDGIAVKMKDSFKPARSRPA